MQFHRPFTTVVIVLAAVAVLASGCTRNGKTVTITDKDTNAPYLPPTGDAQRPIKKFGLQTIENAQFAIEMQAEYALVESLANSDGSETSIDHHLVQARDELYANVRDRVAQADASLDRQFMEEATPLDSILYRKNSGEFRDRLQRVSVLVDQVVQLLVSAKITEDVSAQSAIAAKMLDEVSNSYSSAFDDDGKKMISSDQYEDAFAYFVRAQVLVSSILFKDRSDINKRFSDLKSDALLSEKMPDKPMNSDDFDSRVTYLRDSLLRLSNIAIEDIDG